MGVGGSSGGMGLSSVTGGGLKVDSPWHVDRLVQATGTILSIYHTPSSPPTHPSSSPSLFPRAALYASIVSYTLMIQDEHFMPANELRALARRTEDHLPPDMERGREVLRFMREKEAELGDTRPIVAEGEGREEPGSVGYDNIAHFTDSLLLTRATPAATSHEPNGRVMGVIRMDEASRGGGREGWGDNPLLGVFVRLRLTIPMLMDNNTLSESHEFPMD
ncbi:hypothetical protein BT69DRAFT_440733 [Atractiella rhizophila]|nr:hypothetical protein BT69DRAFT_440733 [Atractiella rhizophila]